jgi:hypothetical protein
VDAEPLISGRRPEPGVMQQPLVALRVHRGKGGGTAGQSYGVNWGSSELPPWADSSGAPKRRMLRCSFRVSDEAIVSVDLGGQHNLLASQGPLDERVEVGRGRARLNRKILARDCASAPRALNSLRAWRMCWVRTLSQRISGVSRRMRTALKPRLTS